MICRSCCDAADGVPGAKHCKAKGGPGAKCFCQHRPPAKKPKTAITVYVYPDPPHIARAIRELRRGGGGR